MVNLASLLSNAPPDPKTRHLVDVFMSPAGVGRRYLLGRNEHSLALAELIDIDGFVDDFAIPGTVWNDKPVIRGNEAPVDAIIVNCSMSISPVSAHKSLEKNGIANILAYIDLYIAHPGIVPLPKFVSESRADYLLNQNRIESLSACLYDDESRQVLIDLLRYRLTGDYSFMNQYSVRIKDQYFEDFLGLGTGEVFIDAGGYDGDTTELFCEKYPDYKKVFLFEPSSTNIEKAKSRLYRFHSIEFIQLGASDSPGTLWFNSDEESASNVSEMGTTQINVTTIDQQIDCKVTFIKMDIEGWELKALKGSERHIKEDYPKLAIAVYHHPSDFWRIFEFVFSLRKDYKVFLRHYTEGWSETIMYFVPT